ncbi:MAG: EF-P lysine aminoacylase GenX [Xanthomonadales bacterium]|nr:EF-P lysine aminoacylase GenX [Xanthomonadales bacterium]MDL1868354.1 EF-P lysine aminoacylase GenX [Gammaproteobacteria bacterium PRO6]
MAMVNAARLRAACEQRAAVQAHIRAFFAARGVLEVETPLLSGAANPEPNIEPFATTFSGHVGHGARERWLRPSPEFALKRLLAAGIGDCYELGRVFRNGEAGRRHNPEFTMLEWYRVGWDYARLAAETVELVSGLASASGRRVEVLGCTYRELFQRELGLDPFTAPDSALQRALGEVRIQAQGLERDDWLDLVMSHCLQPRMPRDRITVVRDFPSSQAALARVRPGEPAVAERFELYLGAQELANGYQELTDAREQRARFQRDNARRRARGQRELPLDEPLLQALPSLPDCAGVALGIERLLMWLAATDDIADVLTFSFAQA